jgi:hypothetical protein
MPIRCVEGHAVGCPGVSLSAFDQEIPAAIRNFEAQIVREKFQATLDLWKGNSNFHSYYNWSSLGSGLSREVVQDEYLHWPAPTWEGRRSAPVKTGDRSFAFATTRAVSLPARVPLPGGYVEHVLDSQSGAVANVTLRVHTLYPGYIIRWVSFVGDIATSNTLGRGVGAFAGLNEIYGVQIFGELDRKIKERLAESRTR